MIKFIFPALCGIVGVVVGAILKMWFDWMLESKKTEQQKKIILYNKQIKVLEDIYYALIKYSFYLIKVSMDIEKSESPDDIRIFIKRNYKNMSENMHNINNIMMNGSIYVHKNICSNTSSLAYKINMLIDTINNLLDEYIEKNQINAKRLRGLKKFIEKESAQINKEIHMLRDAIYKALGWKESDVILDDFFQKPLSMCPTSCKEHCPCEKDKNN